MNTIKAMADKLTADGWREYSGDGDRSFYRRFETPTRCAGNDDKPGAQVCVLLYGLEGELPAMYTIALYGGLADGTWIKLSQWCLPKDLDAGLALIPRLLATWEFVANYQKGASE